MSWPDPSPGMPADDYTREHRALYARIRGEASRLPCPEPEPRWFEQGPTAAWAEHLKLTAWAHVAIALRDRTPDTGAEPDAA